MVKNCPACGAAMGEKANFCPVCGAKYEEPRETSAERAFCSKCGQPLSKEDRFCSHCGAPTQPGAQRIDTKNLQDQLKKGFDTVTSKINTLAGEEGDVDIRFRELFSQVFTKHTIQEREELFVCGTTLTTPKESEMISEWPKPWLYTRVFLMFALVFAGLYLIVDKFENANGIPGVIFVGSLVVPFSFLVFFWEVNVPRNINIFDVITTFFVGGVFSLISTLIMYDVLDVGGSGYSGAVFVGIAEEVGKILVVAYYINRTNTKYKLNGLLFGASVGAGFAVFETAGYAFRFLVAGGLSTMMDVLLLRAELSIGGHIIWTAIAGFGLVVAKGEGPLRKEHFMDTRFLTFLGLVIALHAVWDMPIHFGSDYNLAQWGLTAIGLVVTFTLINSGLKQVSTIAQRAREAELAASARETPAEGGTPAAAAAPAGAPEQGS